MSKSPLAVGKTRPALELRRRLLRWLEDLSGVVRSGLQMLASQCSLMPTTARCEVTHRLAVAIATRAVRKENEAKFLFAGGQTKSRVGRLLMRVLV